MGPLLRLHMSEEPFPGGQKGLSLQRQYKQGHNFSSCSISFPPQESMGQFRGSVECGTQMFPGMTSAVGAVPCSRR